MKTITTLAAVAMTATLIVSSPAQADVPANVHDGRHGVVDAGWVRTLCATTHDSVKCAIRVPDGFSRMDLEYRLGGQRLASETTWTGTHRTRGPRRFVNRRVVPGVRITCAASGNRLDCKLHLARRFGNFHVVTYSAGDDWGGMIGAGVVI